MEHYGNSGVFFFFSFKSVRACIPDPSHAFFYPPQSYYISGTFNTTVIGLCNVMCKGQKASQFFLAVAILIPITTTYRLLTPMHA